MKSATPEQIFLRFATPCAFILHQRGEIDDEQIADLERAAAGGTVMERAHLEKIFFRAFRRIDTVAAELGKDRWDREVIREYFLHRHNILIDQGADEYKDAPQTLKELCKVVTARIVSKHPSLYVVLLPNGKTRTVIPPFVRDAKVGETLIIHYGYAVERVSVDP